MDEQGPHSALGKPWLHVLAVALVLTTLNVVKPVHADDPAYLLYGAEFAAHPLAPYAFYCGSPFLLPANQVLVPPVLPYWLGLGMALFGDNAELLKCWLFPFALALARATDFLAARLAPSLRVPLLWLCVLSPSILPGFNFMLEVAVLALGMTALAVAMRSLERNSWSLTLLAGLLAGLAFETKYTGIIACAAIVLWCLLCRRPGRALVVVAVALAVVVCWEGWVAWTQGESHFLVHLRLRQGGSVGRCLQLALPLVSQLAGLAPVAALLGLVALGWTGRSILAAGLGALSGLAALALVPSKAPLLTASNGTVLLTPSNLVYGLLAVLVWPVFVSVGLRLLRRSGGGHGLERALDWFLLGWLFLELGGYFALSPFPAARRVAGLLLVLTLLAGRLAHRNGIRPRAVVRLAPCGVALALLFFVTDFLDARAARAAAHAVARGNYTPAQGGCFWHLSFCGFSYYADREGLLPLRLIQRVPRPGDLLALLDAAPLRAPLTLHPEIGLQLIDTVVAGDRFPLQATPGYYAGRTPLEHQRDARVRVLVYRVTTLATAADAGKAPTCSPRLSAGQRCCRPGSHGSRGCCTRRRQTSCRRAGW